MRLVKLVGRVRLAALWLGVASAVAVLSSNQFKATAHHGHAHAPPSAKKLKTPLRITEANFKAGKLSYDRHCAGCHGADGRSATEVAAKMKVRPPDLTSHAVHGLAEGEIYWVITHGIQKSKMPAYASLMNAKERWQTTMYVRHFAGGVPKFAWSERANAPNARTQDVSISFE